MSLTQTQVAGPSMDKLETSILHANECSYELHMVRYRFYLCIYLLTYLLTYLSTHSRTHLLTYLLTYLFTYLLTYTRKYHIT